MGPRKQTKAATRRAALARWWARGPWPCVLLSIDPGKTSGAALIVSRPTGVRLHRAWGVDVYSEARWIEVILQEAVNLARWHELPLVVLLEDWGAGGDRGIAQWVGLGEARGMWRREAVIAAKLNPDVLARSRIVLCPMQRWRSRVVEETGAEDAAGRWRRFEPEEWKDAALRAARGVFIDGFVPPGDAAEAACQGYYGVRSDEVLVKLGKRHLDRWEIPVEDRVRLEPVIKTGLEVSS